MAAAFCVSCGQPLVSGARFCTACGAPVGADRTPGLLSEPSPRAGASDARLDLGGRRNFVVQHESISDRWNYRVLDSDGNLLLSVRGNPARDVTEEMKELRQSPPPQVGEHKWLREVPPAILTWDILTPADVPWGKIVAQYVPVKQKLGYVMQPTFTAFDSASTAVLSVHGDTVGFAEVGATATFPDGKVMFTSRGSVLRYNFSLLNPGGAEIARVREAKLSLRDSYALDLLGEVEPLAAILFVIILDREEQSRRARH